MEKLKKFLKKLPTNYQDRAELAIEKILAGDFSSLDVKPLKGKKDTFRVRVGSLRIIFTHHKDVISVKDITHRSEKTYRDTL